MTTTVVPQAQAVAPKKRHAIKWATKAVTIEEGLVGRLFPHEDGVAWAASNEFALEPIERHADRAFYALIKPEGGCDIVVADSAGLRKAVISEMPLSVVTKSLHHSLGGSFDGELVMPVMRHEGFRPLAQTPTPKTESQCDSRMAAYLKHAHPDEC